MKLLLASSAAPPPQADVPMVQGIHPNAPPLGKGLGPLGAYIGCAS